VKLVGRRCPVQASSGSGIAAAMSAIKLALRALNVAPLAFDRVGGVSDRIVGPRPERRPLRSMACATSACSEGYPGFSLCSPPRAESGSSDVAMSTAVLNNHA
jgi:hypothetical protein